MREFTPVEKQFIIIGNRLSNCVCNHFLLKTLVHLRRETSSFLCKEECHDDLSLVNHAVPNLNFPVFSIALALFSLEKQPESTSDFLGNFEGQFHSTSRALFELQPKAFPFYLTQIGGFPNFVMALKSTCRSLLNCFCWGTFPPFSQRAPKQAVVHF